MITAGIDVGSTTSKGVFLDGDMVLARVVIPSGVLPGQSARDVFEKCLEVSNINKDKIEAIATTGYGRRLAKFGDMIITEIKACALGASTIKLESGEIKTIIDVGGQDTKVITLNDDNDVEDFSMNDKCAAGTGRFLEMLAHKLDLSYEEFVEEAFNTEADIHMNSTCAVFAESEVVSLLARGYAKGNIAAAAHTAISEKISSMVRRMGQKEVMCFTGGGALNKALAKALEEALNKKVYIPEHPQTIVALGAARAAQLKLQNIKISGI